MDIFQGSRGVTASKVKSIAFFIQKKKLPGAQQLVR